ncbi:MAG TPA: hypothetical protein DIT13_17395 [Verrucomicrobiales bacterium]|nr:hypothetical protein [Verrucomicrobiales bacterium]
MTMNSVPRALFMAAMLLASAASPTRATDAPDISDMQSHDLRSGGDEKMRHFVIHKPAPPPDQGWRTLFVLPGARATRSSSPL